MDRDEHLKCETCKEILQERVERNWGRCFDCYIKNAILQELIMGKSRDLIEEIVSSWISYHEKIEHRHDD